ncbi:MAG TPA: hypothetical protein VEY70_09240, partial [Metabacillus sp.]|nr:hypothetical protein [Metabacillus sp.]
MNVKIILYKNIDSEKTIYVNSKLYHTLQIDKYSNTNLHFGTSKENCHISIDSSLKHNEIKIPAIINGFIIPTVFHY